MAEIKGIAHFSIPVSDVDKSTRFYTEIGVVLNGSPGPMEVPGPLWPTLRSFHARV